MSHTQYPPVKIRLHRSHLAVPASNPKMIRKAADSAADYVFLDLEDAVAPGDKDQARANAVEALRDIDWKARGKTISVRINGLDTQFMYRDVVDLMEQAGAYLDTILIPKTGVAADVYMVEVLCSQIEQARGLDRPVGIEALIETALGMANVETIAKSSPRLEALHFGVADYAASLRARTVNIGGLTPDYPGDQWHHALSRLIVACRAHGLRALDGPFGDFRDPEGFTLAARRAAALGAEGKWAIHPNQIEMANEIFSPPAEEIEKAHQILAALDQAAAEGKGAAQLDGRMIDAASAKMADNIVQLDQLIRAKG